MVYSTEWTAKEAKSVIGDVLLSEKERVGVRRWETGGKGEAYRLAWEEVCAVFEAESGNRLAERMEIFKTMLRWCGMVMKEG